MYDGSEGRDGYISVEVQPRHASDTQATIKEALELVGRVQRRNLMIKVPATEPGLEAISSLIGQGIPVNVTLIFGVDQYRQAATAIAGAGASRSGRPESSAPSPRWRASLPAASMPRSRRGAEEAHRKRLAHGAGAPGKLLGKAAIANAKRAYRAFGEIFGSPRFAALSGAQRQRVLWASTGTKDPAYPDTLYVDELIGPDTVNTLPDTTIEASRDHATAERTVDRDVDGARKLMDELREVGVDVDDIVSRQLVGRGRRGRSRSPTSRCSRRWSKRPASCRPRRARARRPERERRARARAAGPGSPARRAGWDSADRARSDRAPRV